MQKLYIGLLEQKKRNQKNLTLNYWEFLFVFRPQTFKSGAKMRGSQTKSKCIRNSRWQISNICDFSKNFSTKIIFSEIITNLEARRLNPFEGLTIKTNIFSREVSQWHSITELQCYTVRSTKFSTEPYVRSIRIPDYVIRYSSGSTAVLTTCSSTR